jgi:hypothetical protein
MVTVGLALRANLPAPGAHDSHYPKLPGSVKCRLSANRKDTGDKIADVTTNQASARMGLRKGSMRGGAPLRTFLPQKMLLRRGSMSSMFT